MEITQHRLGVEEYQYPASISVGAQFSRLTNCPQCGAPLNPLKLRCEYCDVPVLDLAALSDMGYSFMRLNLGGKIVVCKARVVSGTVTMVSGETIKMDLELDVESMTQGEE